MIRQVDAENTPQFMNAAKQSPYFASTLPAELEIFGGSSALMRFYITGEGGAVQLKGCSARLCGTYDSEEMGLFLTLMGADRVYTAGNAPKGYAGSAMLHCMVYHPSEAPPCPDESITIEKEPSSYKVADFLFGGEGGSDAWDDFYSELCTKRSRGAAQIWTAQKNGSIIAAAGACCMTQTQAYLSAIETAEALRGKGIGSWLVGSLAAELAAQGRRVTLFCYAERLDFYKRLGFEPAGWVQECIPKPEA